MRFSGSPVEYPAAYEKREVIQIDAKIEAKHGESIAAGTNKRITFGNDSNVF